jgi:hypothetical protein
MPQSSTHIVVAVPLQPPVQAASKFKGEQSALHPPETLIWQEIPLRKSNRPQGFVAPESAAWATDSAKPKKPLITAKSKLVWRSEARMAMVWSFPEATFVPFAQV